TRASTPSTSRSPNTTPTRPSARARAFVADPRPITGTTRLAAVIGTPVGHSRSPMLANAAFAASGTDWTMVAVDVPEGGAAQAIAAVRALGIGGLMVTMPH